MDDPRHARTNSKPCQQPERSMRQTAETLTFEYP